MNPLLVIFHPRRIPECMAAFQALNIPKAYLQGYTERGLCEAFPALVQNTDYSHYIAISDDTIIRQESLQAVIEGLEQDVAPVVTGWSNLDGKDPRVNLTRCPLKGDAPTVDAYDMLHWSEIMGHPEPFLQTWFAGMCLTGMSRELWERYPFDCFGDPGYASDFKLCKKLEVDGVPILAAREGFVMHAKEKWNYLDTGLGRELLIGVDVGVRFEGE